jgi:hypothetical protein
MLLVAWSGSVAIATTTEWVVTNPRTGLAIAGFDPVAYFIDAAATPGRPDFEFRYRAYTVAMTGTGQALKEAASSTPVRSPHAIKAGIRKSLAASP